MQNSAEDAALKKMKKSNNQKKINLKSQLDAGLINKAPMIQKYQSLTRSLMQRKRKWSMTRL